MHGVSTTVRVNKQVTFEKLPTRYYPEWGFRPNTPMYPLSMSFIFINGGMGDYLTWSTAVEWLASEATWIHGTWIVPTYFKEFAQYILRDYPDWVFKDYSELNEIPKVNDMPFRGPVELSRESLNATGAHLLTCGWVYFTNKEKAPDGWDRYPILKQADLDKIELPLEAKPLKAKQYAVITTGITTNSRVVPPGAWNYIIEYVKARGLTPVFIGKETVITGNARNIHTRFGNEIHFDQGVDLRNKTSLMQAAAVMSRAAVVIGHDNGLLHLAGCTEVPIVFGYNLASPEHRQPKRAIGKVYNVHLAPGELGCNFCQSKFNFVIGYNFRECFHKDLACMTMLFANGAERWKRKIDEALVNG
jgi:hypothetical protein